MVFKTDQNEKRLVKSRNRDANANVSENLNFNDSNITLISLPKS